MRIPDESQYSSKRIDKSELGDSYFLINGTGMPTHLDTETQWEIFVGWLEKVSLNSEENSAPRDVGRELVKWGKRKDTYAMYLLMKVHWDTICAHFRTSYAPPVVIQFIDSIMDGHLP